MDDVNTKRIKIIENADRFSELPDNVIDCILNLVPIHDAVRTSILSSKWRYHWTRLGNLVFDQKFLTDFFTPVTRKLKRVENDEFLNLVYSNTIGSILLLHNGPIHKFVLHVPSFRKDVHVDVAVNRWIRVMSCSGVKEIIIHFCSIGVYTSLCSSIFDCLELRRLVLHECQILLPYDVTGFAHLISLELHRVRSHIDGDLLSSLISKCHKLEYLFLECCSFPPLSITAPKLKTLSVVKCIFTKLLLQNVGNLVTFCFRDSLATSMQPFVDLFGLMPKAENIYLGTLWFMVLDLGIHQIPKVFPTSLECHTDLTLVNISEVSEKGISVALCILRSSPNLRALNISFRKSRYSINELEEAAAVTFLKEQLSELIYPKSLTTVKMKRLTGTNPQIVLLKSIMTSCQALETLYANAEDSISKDAELKMMDELMVCRPASSKAEVNYSKGEGSAAKSYPEGQDYNSMFEF